MFYELKRKALFLESVSHLVTAAFNKNKNRVFYNIAHHLTPSNELLRVARKDAGGVGWLVLASYRFPETSEETVGGW